MYQQRTYNVPCTCTAFAMTDNAVVYELAEFLILVLQQKGVQE